VSFFLELVPTSFLISLDELETSYPELVSLYRLYFSLLSHCLYQYTYYYVICYQRRHCLYAINDVIAYMLSTTSLLICYQRPHCLYAINDLIAYMLSTTSLLICYQRPHCLYQYPTTMFGIRRHVTPNSLDELETSYPELVSLYRLYFSLLSVNSIYSVPI